MNNKLELFLDTNALLNLGNNAFKENFLISQKTLEEIELIKTDSRKDPETKWKARNIARLLDENYGNYRVVPYSKAIQDVIEDFYLSETPDNIILASAYLHNKENHPVIVCSDDLN